MVFTGNKKPSVCSVLRPPRRSMNSEFCYRTEDLPFTQQQQNGPVLYLVKHWACVVRLCPVLFMDQDSTNSCHFLALHWYWYWYFAPHRLSKPVLNRGTRLCIPAALNLHASSLQARGLVPIKMQQVLSEDIDKPSHIRGAGLFYSTWISLGVSFICFVPDSPHHFKLPKLTLRMH